MKAKLYPTQKEERTFQERKAYYGFQDSLKVNAQGERIMERRPKRDKDDAERSAA